MRILQTIKDKWEHLNTLESALCDHPLYRSREFFFIQIGANDGQLDDPIHATRKKFRWKGLLIEPQNEMFQQLKQNYSWHDGVYFENFAISNINGTLNLHKIAENDRADWHRGIASLNPTKGDIYFESQIKGKKIKTEEVQVTTLKSLTDKYGIQKSHLILLDSEGHELSILGSDGFFATSPDIVHYEHKHLSHVEQDKCLKILSANSYKMFCGKWETTALRRK